MSFSRMYGHRLPVADPPSNTTGNEQVLDAVQMHRNLTNDLTAARLAVDAARDALTAAKSADVDAEALARVGKADRPSGPSPVAKCEKNLAAAEREAQILDRAAATARESLEGAVAEHREALLGEAAEGQEQALADARAAAEMVEAALRRDESWRGLRAWAGGNLKSSRGGRSDAQMKAGELTAALAPPPVSSATGPGWSPDRLTPIGGGLYAPVETLIGASAAEQER